MKSIIGTIAKTLIFAILFSSSAAVFANTNTGNDPIDDKKIKESSNIQYSIYPLKNTTKIRVAYEKKGKEKVTIKIYDDKKNLIFTDIQRNNTELKRNYDLGKIGNGVYFVKIKSGEFETQHKIFVGKKQVKTFESYLSASATNNKIRIAFQNATNPVKISITDEKGKNLYDKTLFDTENFSSLFNLAPLDKGNYTVSISSNGNVTEQSYTIK
ncbi:DUF3244 domain-containing protein [Flexithrix dorotheae]|uniref:DUF3244 domain-containing protein n=1 Tax=Flexithrix dorotheae TaxID=70993 RepID=UPI00036A7E7F|nr:T9SS type A sorting domain-containing protein [Flexithrix dorotheae]